MATGVGGPLGAAMIGGALMSGGVSAGVQKATTGEVDWGKVAVDGMIGGLAGGAGAGAGALIGQSARVAAMNPFTRGVAINGTEAVVEGMASRGLTGENPFNPRGMAEDLIGTGKAKAPAGDLGDTQRVYRGTSIVAEQELIETTGMSMSDAAKRGYVESGGSLDAARAASEQAHAKGIRDWGSEGEYAHAHSEFGQHLTEVGPRSMLSFTTDPDVARGMAGEHGAVYKADLRPGEGIPQPNPNSTESEILVRHMTEVTKWEG
jgi:hypothetical protein